MTSALASKQIPKTTRLNSSVIFDTSFDFNGLSISKHHGVILGEKELKKSGEENFSTNEDPAIEKKEVEHEQEYIFTDADTVKELVEMKYLPQKRKNKLRTPTGRKLSRKYQILIEEVI